MQVVFLTNCSHLQVSFLTLHSNSIFVIHFRLEIPSNSLMDETIKDSDNRSLKLIIPRFYIIIMCWLEHYKHHDHIVDNYYAAYSNIIVQVATHVHLLSPLA